MANKDKEIQPYIESKIYHLLSKPINKKGCKLCESKYREEAEAMYEKVNNVSRVQKFLNEEREESFNYSSVRQHLLFHYSSPSSMDLVSEQFEEIERWSEIQKDQASAMIRTMALLERELLYIESRADGLPDVERRKNAEIVVKISTTLLSYRTKYEELKEKQKPILFILNQLKDIMKEELASAGGDTKVKRAITNIIESFQTRCGDIIIEHESK